MNYLIANSPKFGKVLELTNEMFLNEIDKENKNVTVIVQCKIATLLSVKMTEVSDVDPDPHGSALMRSLRCGSAIKDPS